MGTASASISFDPASNASISAGSWLENEYGVPETSLGVPIGLRETDLFFRSLEEISGRPTPVELALERGRWWTRMWISTSFLFGKKVVLYGEETLVVGLASFLAEIIGCMTLFCATGEQSGCLENILRERLADYRGDLQVVEGADFAEIAQAVEEIKPDLMVGNSKAIRLTENTRSLSFESDSPYTTGAAPNESCTSGTGEPSNCWIALPTRSCAGLRTHRLLVILIFDQIASPR
jgi:nitrogenase molybdenum-iron protein NifN